MNDGLHPENNEVAEQLRKLPEKIGRYVRRFAHVNGLMTIQYSTNGFFDFGSDAIQTDNDVLVAESGENLPELVRTVQDNIAAWKIIEARNLDFEPDVYIDPQLRDQGVTNVALIRPFGVATTVAPCIWLPLDYFHIFFMVKAVNYLLAFGRRGDHYFLRRNNSIVRLKFPPRRLGCEDMTLAITWSVEEIAISGYTESNQQQAGTKRQGLRSKDRVTDPVSPPNTLYTWARRQLLLPSTSYDRPGQVFDVIMDALRTVNEEISRTDDIAGFWDEQREGNRIKKLEPKREPTITRHIESRLRDITLQKNIDIAREIELGSSKLDLLFSAPMDSGNTAKICVEVKKAHADDLVHGLAVQLPEYMRRVETEYGIYCVLYFGTEYPHKLRQFKPYMPEHYPEGEEGIESNLELLLSSVCVRLPYKNVRIVMIDVSRKPTASNL